ncbi:MAG TPA: ThuA domain-containing protein [Dehalococcoidia bacterium]|jgi:type 1 glutamine amidotransferase|nr:ThuA domain-containing protein [Dehalococcoidia bacterium]MEE2927340.1 ThuA domain-containing protein [Chloroflexota bacterium]HIM47450.1 ThuA domain-containing protein [Dehalococcoidia bacterium]
MKLLVISGGRHPYEESTPVLERFLKGAGHDITVTEDPSVLANAPDLNSYDALVFNTRRENIPDFGEWALSSSEQNGMKDFISSGKGFVCLHISTCLPGGWPEYHDITGGGWISGTSFHPPYGRFTVNISNSGHPGVNGVAEFDTDDELYMGLAITEGNDVFLTGHTENGTHPWGPDRAPKDMPGGTFPLGWTRRYGQGKVFTLLLGHDGKSFESPEFQQIVLNGVNWSTAS